MIIAIGNAPSSGSTYLADLLDSLPFAVCGPELHPFSPRCHFDDYENVRRNGFRRSANPCCFATYGVHFAWVELPVCGITFEEVRGILAEAPTFPDFYERFLRRYADYRGKDARLFFEKTPGNIHNASRFLESFPDSVFLHIVRDPLYVCRSLRRRGAPFSVAAATWLVDMASAYALRDHERFYTMHYEELVGNPWGTLARFLDFIGEKMPAENLEALYRANAYRPTMRRSKTWSHSGYGRMGDANDIALGSEAKKVSNFMARFKIAAPYAQLFGLPEATCEEVAECYGYPLEIVGSEYNGSARVVDLKSKLWLTKKWVKDFVTTSARLGDLPTYLSPVEIRHRG